MQASSRGDQVRETLNRWLSAFNEKDINKLLTLYDPDTVYANAAAPRMVGVEGLRPWYEEVFKDTSLHVLFSEETLFESDGLALIAGKYHFKSRQADGNYRPGDSGRVALLFRRALDGRWLLAYDIDNTPPDVSAADFK